MSRLTKIRGLWRFDANEDDTPVLVSRRRFLFLGACAATGALLPELVYDPILAAWNACADPPILNMDSFYTVTIAAYKDTLMKNLLEYRPAIIDADGRPDV